MTLAPSTADVPPETWASTGIAGLDDVLHGGLTPERLYLVEGMPGSGKTTLALQFLSAGARRGESVLHISLSESEQELRAMAGGHGWSLDGITIRELVTTDEVSAQDDRYTMFHPAEVELVETTRRIMADIEAARPTRVVLDSLSEFLLLTGGSLHFRRQILVLKRFFMSRRCTVLLLDDLTTAERNMLVQSVVHGVFRLEQLSPEYGAQRRRLQVRKLRGKTFRGGYHDYTIVRGGLAVFPRLVSSEHKQPGVLERFPSQVAELDLMLGGGLERGTSTLVVGAPGTGKSTLSSLFAAAAAAKGENAAFFIFDESEHTLISRVEALGVPLGRYVREGRVVIRHIDPAELSPGEFAHAIRESVERERAAVVIIDSLNGYLNAMPEERFLVAQLHEVLAYLGQRHVVTILVGAQHGLLGMNMRSPVDASYLADAIILMRYYEAAGELRQAISVIKKRGGDHERTIRDFRLADGRIQVGKPLRRYRGVLSGIPVDEGDVPRRDGWPDP
ncbi:MAG: AAA family ATPase [Betaproteobacteria bacterium]|nr:AAA family ATPase [Betaproteobacteria bacterium]